MISAQWRRKVGGLRNGEGAHGAPANFQV